MTPRLVLAWLLLGACGGTPLDAGAPSVAPQPASAACEALPEDALPDDSGFALGHGYDEVRVYRLGPGGCGTLITSFDAEGPLAFSSVGEPKLDGMPDLSIETWLMHGDRRHQRFSWSGSRYVATGRAVEIPGPRR